MTERLRLLLVDDDEVDRVAICRALRHAGVDAEVDQESSALTGLERATAGHYDCVLLDFELPELTADQFLRRLRDAGCASPVLMVTGHDEEHIAAAFDAGATDFIPKSDVTPQRLASRLRSTLRVAHAEAEAREALAEARRAVALRDQVVAIVSHDLRNPLGAARLAVDQLVEPNLGPNERGALLGAMGRALGRAERLIRDLLEVSRLDGGGMALSRRPIAPTELFGACVHDHAVLAQHAGNPLAVRVAPGVPRVEVDPDRMLQALANLVGNALEHARGSEVELGAAPMDDGRVRLWVRDQGPGIPPELLPHVFDRFYQATHERRAGAGLGLAIARGIVRAHGSDLEVASQPGEGCTFHFALPGA